MNRPNKQNKRTQASRARAVSNVTYANSPLLASKTPLWRSRFLVVLVGIGSMILHACETAAQASGFTAFEMGATLTGVALYQARGYHPAQEIAVPLENGLTLPVVRMTKAIS